VTELGIIWSESRPWTLPLPVVPVGLITAMVPLPDTTPVKPFMLAVIVAVPAATAVTRPVELTVAMEGALDVHVAWLVTSCCAAG